MLKELNIKVKWKSFKQSLFYFIKDRHSQMYVEIEWCKTLNKDKKMNVYVVL